MARSAILQVLGQYANEIFSPKKMSDEEYEQLKEKRLLPQFSGTVRPVEKTMSEDPFDKQERVVVEKPTLLLTMLLSGLVFAAILGTTYGINYSRDRQILESRAQEFQVTSTCVKLYNRLFPKEVTAEMWLSWHEDMFSEDIVKQAKTNRDLRYFLYRLGTEQYVANRGDALTPEEASAGIPMLFQWDERWGFLPYANDVCGISGDAPTVLSMLAIGLTGNTSATPKAMISLANEEGILEDGKPTDDFITWGGMKCGVYAEEIRANEDDIKYCLNTGYPVTLRLGPSVFSSTEHFVIIVSYNSEGYRIYDPMSRENSEKIWKFSDFSAAITGIWWCMWGTY